MSLQNDTDPTAITVNDGNLDDVLRDAASRFQAGHTAEARRLFESVLRAFPQDADAHHNLGVIAMTEGAPVRDAIAHFARAWDANPGHGQFGTSYIRALALAGEHDRAAAVHAEGLRRGLAWPSLEAMTGRPPTAKARGRFSDQPQPVGPQPGEKADPQLAQAISEAVRRGDWQATADLARKFCERSPNNGFGWKAMGLATWRSGHPDTAVAPLRKAASIDPDDAEVHSILGRVYHQLDLLPEAEQALRRTVELRPNAAGDLTDWGQLLGKLNRFAEAEQALKRALAQRPDIHKARFLLGSALMLQDRHTDAVPHFEQLLRAQPSDVQSRKRLLDCFEQTGRLRELEACAREGLEHSPSNPVLLNALADLYVLQGRLTEAMDCHRAIVANDSGNLVSRSALLFLGHMLGEDSTALYEAACEWGQHASAAASAFQDWNLEPAPARLRVGLVSGDLRRHPVGYFLENVLAHVDSERIEWIAYPTVDRMDEQSVRLRAAVAHWHPLTGLDDAGVARQIREDGVHILIDLAGHTSLNRLGVFAWRPAPVQVSWLGYFATTGLDEMDYLIADETSAPTQGSERFSERLWRLPDTRLCFSPPDVDLAVAPSPCLANAAVCFGSFQRLVKVDDRVLDVWAEVLKAVPDARLRLQAASLADAEVRNGVLARLAERGVAPERVSLHGRTSREDYLAAHAEVDILLDTFPYPGGTTTCEALWMGVPTVTLAGDTMISRQGASLLSAAGLPDWIATTPEAFVELAARHASDRQALADLRSGLRDRVLASPLFDGPAFGRNMEEALWRMWAETGEPRCAKLTA
ncbi:MAG: tetratricopeptide repeat protein [Azoarcus sp.]|nr:tetratricopeptide repeat protein [Azoarcus sp.]